MSTIGVKYHNEDIHYIIRKPMEQTVKSPRYKSKWTAPIKPVEVKKKYNGHQTFGLAHYEPPEFKNYLKKGKPRIISSPIKHTSKREKCTADNCKPASLPKISTEVKKEVKKNFVKENIKKAIALQPKVPIPRKVETPRGTAKDMAHLLQMIKIRESEAYGKIPKYLCRRKKQWAREKEMREIKKEALKKQREEMGIGTMGMSEHYYMVNQETRQKILDGLKQNWNELSTQFLKLPVMTDTWPKIKRKMCLEREIEQLERDIKLVECHPFIYLERHDKRNLESLVAEKIEQKMSGKKQKEDEQEEEKEPKEETKAEGEKIQAENTEQKPVPPSEEVTEEKKEVIEEKKEEKEDKEINVNNN